MCTGPWTTWRSSLPPAHSIRKVYVMFIRNTGLCCALLRTSLVLATVALLPRETTLQAQSCAPTPAGVVSWWKGEGNAVDAISGINGILHGAGFTSGEVGSAFTFDGTTQYIEVPSSPVFNPSGSFSLEAWIYATSASHGEAIMGKWSDTGDYPNDRSYLLALVPGNVLQFSIADAAHQVD